MCFTTCNNSIVSTIFSKLYLFGFNSNSDVLLEGISFIFSQAKRNSGVLTVMISILLKRDKVIRTCVSWSKWQKVKGLSWSRCSCFLPRVKHITKLMNTAVLKSTLLNGQILDHKSNIRRIFWHSGLSNVKSLERFIFICIIRLKH